MTTFWTTIPTYEKYFVSMKSMSTHPHPGQIPRYFKNSGYNPPNVTRYYGQIPDQEGYQKSQILQNPFRYFNDNYFPVFQTVIKNYLRFCYAFKYTFEL